MVFPLLTGCFDVLRGTVRDRHLVGTQVDFFGVGVLRVDFTQRFAAAWLAFLGVAARQTESVHDARDFVVAREGAALVQAKETGA